MKQSKLESFIEACVGVFTGYVLSFFVMQFIIVPIWNLPITVGDNLVIGIVFTVVAIARGYFWRRFFNAGVHRVVHGWFSR